MPSPFPWTAPIGKPTRPFAGWMRSTRSVRAFAPPQLTASRPAYESRCNARTSGSYRVLCRWRRISAHGRFPFWLSMWPIRTPLAAHESFSSDLALLPEELPVLRRIAVRPGTRVRDRFSFGLHRGESRQAAAHPAVLRRPSRQDFLSFGSLQRAGVFRGDRRDWTRATLLLYIGAGGGHVLRVNGDGTAPDDFSSALNGERMRELRASIRAGARRECKTCVCSMWRDPHDLASSIL